MTGRMLHIAPERPADHDCRPPGEETMMCRSTDQSPLIAADVPPGSVWLCDCGNLWESTAYGGSLHWERAGRLTRWRYRKATRP